MKTLLKDLPEHKERIEGNYSLVNDITRVLKDNSEYSYTMECNVIKAEYFESNAQEIVEKVINFINENYEWKGIKA